MSTGIDIDAVFLTRMEAARKAAQERSRQYQGKPCETCGHADPAVLAATATGRVLCLNCLSDELGRFACPGCDAHDRKDHWPDGWEIVYETLAEGTAVQPVIGT